MELVVQIRLGLQVPVLMGPRGWLGAGLKIILGSRISI